jgi:hypothetical protein
MSYRVVICTIAAALLASGAQAADDAKYPNFKGQWTVILKPGLEGQRVKFDPNKPWGRGQEAPLTPEYQKVHEASMADQAKGGLGNYPTATCHPGGMPRMMSTGEYEYVVTPETTYILIGGEDHYRRIFTDGRPWPTEIDPTYSGYSIGHWLDEGGTGGFNVLEVETRGPFKGPRAYDATGLPLAFDNQSVFKERFYLDKADPNVLHDMITVIDNALTRPWTVDKTYRRNSNPRPKWREFYCVDGVVNVVIGKENYFLSADGMLMPAKKDQAPPDLRYFKQTHN